MDGLLQRFPNESVRFISKMCRWSIAMSVANMCLLSTVLTHISLPYITLSPTSLHSVLRSHFDDKLAAEFQILLDMRILIHSLVLVRMIMFLVQLFCRISILFKLGKVAKLLDLERKLIDQAAGRVMTQEEMQVVEETKNLAVQSLVQIPQSLFWKTNHRIGMISLIWIAICLSSSYYFDSVSKVTPSSFSSN